MLRFTAISFFLLVGSAVFAQAPKTTAASGDSVKKDVVIEELIGAGEVEVPEPDGPDDSPVFTVVEEMPSFPGGDQAMFSFIRQNVRYPNIAKEDKIQGKIYVVFIVEKDGRITDVKIERGVDGGGLNEEAIRVVKTMPKWKPGINGGKPVRVSYTLPITFKLT